MRRVYKFDFSKYSYSIDEEKGDFRIYRFINEDVTSMVMNNPLLDLMLAYDTLALKYSEDVSNSKSTMTWETNSDYPDKFICNKCGFIFDMYFADIKQMNFCPCCGSTYIKEKS